MMRQVEWLEQSVSRSKLVETSSDSTSKLVLIKPISQYGCFPQDVRYRLARDLSCVTAVLIIAQSLQADIAPCVAATVGHFSFGQFGPCWT